MEITHLQDMQQIIGAARMGFKRLITQKIPAILVSYFYLHKATLPARLRRVVLSGIVTTAGFCHFGSQWHKEIQSELCTNGRASTLASSALTKVKIK